MDIEDRIKVIVSDFDGTLVRMDVDWERLKERLRKELNDEAFQGSLDDDLRRLRKISEEAFCYLCSVVAKDEIAGFRGFNDKLVNVLMEKPCAIFSSNTHQAIETILKRTRLRPFIVGKEDVQKGKPNEEGLLLIAKHFSVEPKDMLFIGNSKVDEKAGKRAGVETVLW